MPSHSHEDSRGARRRAHAIPEALAVGTVVAIVPADGSGTRLCVRVGDDQVVVAPEILAAIGVSPGVDLDQGQCAALLAGARLQALYDRGVLLLAGRALSGRELRTRLMRLGGAHGEVAQVASRLSAQGLLNDESFALQHASRAAARGVSRQRLALALRRRGVAGVIAERAADEVAADTGEDEFALAMKAAEGRLRALRSLPAAVARRRLLAFLARRGFPGSVARRVVDESLRRIALR